VVSNKMKKTIVVEVSWLAKDPKYKKYLRKHTRLYAHDERGECQTGDRVEVIETRPLSKLKRWRVLRRL
jgi:small subunit ribosomal protein S17